MNNLAELSTEEFDDQAIQLNCLADDLLACAVGGPSRAITTLERGEGERVVSGSTLAGGQQFHPGKRHQ
jgi:hypothetical protein